MTTTVIINGQLLDQNGERTGNVLVDDETGNIIEIGSAENGDQTVDATGCLIMPGFVDLHSHLRQPGNEAAETIESGSRAAAKGGYTAVVAMPNTDPCVDSAAVFNEILALAKSSLCEVVPSAAITIGRGGEELSPMAELARLGVRIFTDDGTGVQDDLVMRRALEYGSSIVTNDATAIVLAQHCEVTALSEGGVMHEGEVSSRLGLGGQPAEAEELMVMRDIALARLTGMRVHFQHLSTVGSVELVRAAKASGVAVTAEATPHHIFLTDQLCSSYDSTFKVHPPLRTAADTKAVRQGLADGTIDAIATDHAPHTSCSKELPFDQAAPGMTGLETAFAVANTELGLEPARLLEIFSTRPAEIAGVVARHGGPIEVGRAANLVVVDLQAEWTVDPAEMASLSKNTPFRDQKLKGKVRHTIYEGEPVVVEGEPTR